MEPIEWRTTPDDKMEDREGLNRAYGLDEGVYVDGNDLYVAGTKSMRDVWDDLKIPFHLTSKSERYQNADRVLQSSPQIRRVVGHSLGGAVTLELAKRHPERQLSTETYGAPVASFSRGGGKRHRNWQDPVSMLDFGATTDLNLGGNPHSYKNLGGRKG